MKKFSFAPTLTLKGRKFKGPRGWSGKPSHPPLTDIPIAAYIIAAGFDVVSTAVVSVFAALTGLADARDSSEAGTQARRTINAHAGIMITVTVLALANLAWRLSQYNTATATPAAIAVLSVVVAALVSVGATFGGALVFEYGFNVETAGDHPVWHQSEDDVFPGED